MSPRSATGKQAFQLRSAAVRQNIHVDMDAFFASVEQLDDPELRGKPVLVGGPPPRGVVAAASYEARPYGPRSAMAMAQALKLCPHAIVVPGRHHRYSEVSAEVFAIFRRYTPDIEKLSVDEAFLDVTASRSLFGDGETIARKIKGDIRRELGLAASAGVAPSKFVAKIASDMDKPDGLVVVAEDEVKGFLAPLPVRRMWGVGPKAAAKLEDRGFRTIGDLARAGSDRLEALLGSWGRSVSRLAVGDDDRPVVTGAPAKSVGAEETFGVDLRRRPELERALLAQSTRVAERLTRSARSGRLVTIKVKYGDHSLRSRQKRLPSPVSDTDAIYAAAKELLGRFEDLGRGVRLTGVAVGELSSGPPAPTLFPEPERDRRTKLEQTVSTLRDRFGAKGIVRGSLVDDAGPTSAGGGRPLSPSRRRRED
jgi:DNA polymerase-4